MSEIITNWPGISGTKHVRDIVNFDYQPDDILWVCDTLSFENLDNLRQRKNFPKFIVNDNSASVCYDNDLKIYSTPFRGLELEFLLFDDLLFDDTDNLETKYCFNFLINKKQINRYLLINLVEYFEFDSFDYTWSGQGKEFDMTQIINEWNQVDPSFQTFSSDLRSKMLSHITIAEKFINFAEQKLHEDVSIRNYGGNRWTWDNIFSESMTKTAVSLISESVAFQRSSVFTEKTLYAIMALTFPLYIGGYGHADQLKQMGFDVFDDIINHSYQYKETLFERCYYAFFNNLQLLSNLQLASTLRQQHYSRLKNNRDKLFQKQITMAVDTNIKSWPEPLQSVINPVWANHKLEIKKYLNKNIVDLPR